MLDPQERLRHLIEHLSDAVYIVDIATNTFTSLNPAASRLTGYTQEELLGGTITKIISPESLIIVQKMIKQKRRSNTPTVYEVEIIHKEGRRIPVEISSRMIFEGGKPIEVLGIARDISERKLAERQKETFFSLITHEIKNPLTSISMYTQLLQKKAEKNQEERELQMLAVIQNQVDAITQLMSDFMEVNQLQLKKFTIKKESFDMNEAVSEVIRLFGKQNSGHRIEKKGKIIRMVHADKQRVSQVLINLISNAIKYSEKGTKIVITLKELKEGITVSVKDSGFGIAENEQKAIFDLFYRVPLGKQAAIKGHGLGLYICREILSSHKGKIWLESEVGKGSNFTFFLPGEEEFSG